MVHGGDVQHCTQWHGRTSGSGLGYRRCCTAAIAHLQMSLWTYSFHCNNWIRPECKVLQWTEHHAFLAIVISNPSHYDVYEPRYYQKYVQSGNPEFAGCQCYFQYGCFFFVISPKHCRARVATGNEVFCVAVQEFVM